MDLMYEVNHNDQTELNKYLWCKANEYTMSEVNAKYNNLVEKLKEYKCPIYAFEKLYNSSYECNHMKELSFAEIKKGFDKILIPDLKSQFIYEDALFKLIMQQSLIPAQSGKTQPIYDNGYHIKVNLEGSFGNRFCYVLLEFPYSLFRISPFIK